MKGALRRKLLKNTMESNIFDILTEYLTNERLDAILLQNEEYLQLQKEIDNVTEEIEDLNLTIEQKQIADKLISTYTALSSTYNKLTYQQAFRDCISLLKEIELI